MRLRDVSRMSCCAPTIRSRVTNRSAVRQYLAIRRARKSCRSLRGFHETIESLAHDLAIIASPTSVLELELSAVFAVASPGEIHEQVEPVRPSYPSCFVETSIHKADGRCERSLGGKFLHSCPTPPLAFT